MIIIRDKSKKPLAKSGEADLSVDSQYEKWIESGEFDKIADEPHLWVVGEFDEQLDDCRKSRIETYYCGYLGFYEQQSRSHMIEYDILFKWHKDGKSVHVYLFPAPLRLKIKSQAAKEAYDRLVIAVNAEADEKNKNGGGGGNTAGNKNYAVTPPPQTLSSGTSDPPGTSGPPPPKY